MDGHANGPGKGDAPPKKPSIFKRAWKGLDLNFQTILMMVKGSMAPTIAIAMYQSDAVAREYTTLGYLMGIISLLSLAIFPRAKFLQTLFLNVLFVCFGAAVGMLQLYCGVKARQNNTGPGVMRRYDGAQSAVCAIFLCVQVFFANALKALRPDLQFPVIIFSIFTIVSSSYGPSFTEVAQAEDFILKLLKTFLSGMALALGVNTFFFPVSSRKVVFKELAGYLKLLTGVMKAETAYVGSLANVDPMEFKRRADEATDAPRKRGKHDEATSSPVSTPAAGVLKGTVLKLLELHGKLNGDLTLAKREFAIGKLSAHHLAEIWLLLRGIFLPILGITSLRDIIERRAEIGKWGQDDVPEVVQGTRDMQIRSTLWTMEQMKVPFAEMTADLGQALQHVALVLGLEKPPKKKSMDEESKGNAAEPGTPGFAEAFRAKIDSFYARKPEELRQWCAKRGIELPEGFFEGKSELPPELFEKDNQLKERYSRNLFLILYLEFLLWRVGRGALELVLYADARRQDGTLSKTKLLFPGKKRLAKWFRAIFRKDDQTGEENYWSDMQMAGVDLTYMGSAFSKRPDPEHLPPQTAFERFGESLRAVPKFFRTDAAAFGLRVVAATMTIAIIGFVEGSQEWFFAQRLLWAEIMVAISMTRGAGQSTFNFAVRILGTVVAMVGAYVVWYIVVGIPAGVIVFLWLWMTCGFWIVLKKPKYVIVGILSSVTTLLIVGYELQVKKIGKEEAESNGQPAYPTYTLAPYRLATVAGGLGVAYIWTILPYPISEASEIRKDLGGAIYLLANLYSIAHETVRTQVNGSGGDEKVKGTHSNLLESARHSVLIKLLGILTQINANKNFSQFQIKVGGKFPQRDYNELLDCCRRLMQYTALICYASKTYTHSDSHSEWSVEFRKMFGTLVGTSHEITSLLSLLSSALTNGQALPPYMTVPAPYNLVHQLARMDDDLLSIRHIAEPEYSALAVIQLCSQCLCHDIEKLTKLVSKLVGVIDFSFHAVQTKPTLSENSSEDSLAKAAP